MASTDKLIRIMIRAENDMRQLDTAASKVKQLGSKMRNVGMAMTAGITLPVAALGKQIFTTFADFQSTMAEVEARTGATAKQMELMEQAAKEMGRTTMFSATEAGQALVELTSSGASATEAIETLPDVLSLAAAGSIDLKTSADGVTDVMKIFGLTTKDTTHIVDQLAKASGSSSATVKDMLDAMTMGGSVAAQFGLDVQETSAALATMAEAGIKGSMAGTQLRSMFLNMSRDTTRVKDAWSALGVSMYDAEGQMRDIDDVFKDINKAMEGMTMEEQNRIAVDLAGSYGLIGFNALRSADGISEMSASMANAATAAEMQDTMMNTLNGSFAKLRAAWEGLMIALGGAGEGPLTAIITTLANVINKIAVWAEANPKLAQSVMMVVAALAALGPILIILGSIVSAVGTLISAWTAVGAAIAAAGGAAAIFGSLLAFLTGPIGIITILLVALGVALYANREKWGQWAESVTNSAQKAGNAAVNFGTKLNQGLSNAGIPVDKLSAKIEQMLINFINRFDSLPQMIFAIFKNMTMAMTNIGGLIIKGIWQGMKDNLPQLIEIAKEIGRKLQEGIKNSLKIRSPSRVMMELGKQTVEGFNKGIEVNGGVSGTVKRLRDAVAKNANATFEDGSLIRNSAVLTGSRTPQMRSAAVKGFGGGSTTNNLTFSGMIPDDQMRQINEWLAKDTKRQGGRG